MTPTPLVSIVVPVHNDDSTIVAALNSARAQSLAEIEIVCVDDASTDASVELITAAAATDERIRLVRHEHNASAFEARRSGVAAARAPYLLFLDGDDELHPDAARKALACAEVTGADLTGFGVTVVEADGRTGGTYEGRLQPRHRALEGTGVLRGLFPADQPAQGQLWRFLFRTQLLRDAYALTPDELRLVRVNDLPLLFLAAALATRYASIDDRLYRYHLGRGGSGHRVDSVERAEFYASAVRSIDSIGPAVDRLSDATPDPEALRELYTSARLWIIAYACHQLVERADSAVADAALTHLVGVAPAEDIVRATATFYPAALGALKFYLPRVADSSRPVRSVLLATSTLRTGGVSAVIASQAKYLKDAGYRVTVVARSPGSEPAAIPPGVEFVELEGKDLPTRLRAWTRLCRAHGIDLVIDHQMLYTRYWPEFALAARAAGAATIGWLHNFVGRPVYDGTDRLTLMERAAHTLSHIVTLSPLDVAFFKLRGVDHVSYLPNPPSRLLLDAARRSEPRAPHGGRIELLWWGRLEQHTKQVGALLDVAAELRRLGVDFRLRIVGPDWADVTARKLNAQARRRGLAGNVVAVGPLHGQALIDAIESSDAFVSTSIIEGYQLTIAEAQAYGLPVFMYELPWLVPVKDNAGIVSTPQGEAAGLAHAIRDAFTTPDAYAQLSRASLVAAEKSRALDFGDLYQRLVDGSLPAEYSPAPTRADAAQLLGLMVFFAEHAARGRGTAESTTSSIGVRIWGFAAPAGRSALRALPGLRPLAHRAKGWLRAR